jgi:hypothetical protein
MVSAVRLTNQNLCAAAQALRDWFIFGPNAAGVVLNSFCLVLCIIFPRREDNSSVDLDGSGPLEGGRYRSFVRLLSTRYSNRHSSAAAAAAAAAAAEDQKGAHVSLGSAAAGAGFEDAKIVMNNAVEHLEDSALPGDETAMRFEGSLMGHSKNLRD